MSHRKEVENKQQVMLNKHEVVSRCGMVFASYKRQNTDGGWKEKSSARLADSGTKMVGHGQVSVAEDDGAN